MVTKITRGIKISVDTHFKGTYYKENKLHYAFEYLISIENQSAELVQLNSRYWVILDSLNDNEIVKGEGVIGKKPVLNIVRNSSTGAATNIIAGLATGMKSTFSSVILFALAIWGSYVLGGFYGVAIAASAMMATTAMQLAIDAFGPIS